MLATLGANDVGLSMRFKTSGCPGDSALQTAFGSMRELLFMKEALLVCAEDELISAYGTDYEVVREFHRVLPFRGFSHHGRKGEMKM
jgi:hypothetical protein